MVLIQVNLDEEEDNKVGHYNIDHKLKDKRLAIKEMIRRFKED